jgi:hypothetical protein
MASWNIKIELIAEDKSVTFLSDTTLEKASFFRATIEVPAKGRPLQTILFRGHGDSPEQAVGEAWRTMIWLGRTPQK